MTNHTLDKVFIGIAFGSFGLGIGYIQGHSKCISEGNGGFIEGYTKGVDETTPDNARFDIRGGVEYICGINKHDVDIEDGSIICEKTDPKSTMGMTYVCKGVEDPSN